jgi:hypothetical protein
MLRNLLWVDCTAAALAGVAMLALGAWLSRWYGLPGELLSFMGAANLLYATFSLSLAVRRRRAMRLIHLLVFANLAWSAVCVGLAVAFSGSATWLGTAHLIGEALFVAGLARLEWSRRERLTTAGRRG